MTDRIHAGDAYRDAVATALADGWRFASLHATAAGGDRAVRTLLTSQDGRAPDRERCRQRTARCRRSSTSPRPPAGTSARRTTSTVSRFDGHEPLAAARRPRRHARAVRDPGARPRSVPGRGRPDPRRRDRVGPLPLPRRRRPHPPRRRAPLLQAPRTRARGRGAPARRRATGRGTSLRRVLGDATPSRTRTPARKRSASASAVSSRGRERSCSSSSASGTRSTTSARSAPGSASQPARAASPRSSTTPGS